MGIVRAYQHAMDARGKQDEAINQSCDGNSTKIHLAVDSYLRPNYFLLTESAEYESKVAIDFINNFPNCQYIIADKGYDNEVLQAK